MVRKIDICSNPKSDTGANQNIKLLRLPAALLGGCVAVLCVIHSHIRFWVTTYIDFADHFSMNLQ